MRYSEYNYETQFYNIWTGFKLANQIIEKYCEF